MRRIRTPTHFAGNRLRPLDCSSRRGGHDESFRSCGEQSRDAHGGDDARRAGNARHRCGGSPGVTSRHGSASR